MRQLASRHRRRCFTANCVLPARRLPHLRSLRRTCCSYVRKVVGRTRDIARMPARGVLISAHQHASPMTACAFAWGGSLMV